MFIYIKSFFTNTKFITVDTLTVLLNDPEKNQQISLVFHRHPSNVIVESGNDIFHCELGSKFLSVIELAIQNEIPIQIKSNNFDIVSKLYSYFPLLFSALSVGFTTYWVNKKQSVIIEECKQRPNKLFKEIYANNLVKQKLIHTIDKIHHNQHLPEDKILIISGPSGTGKTVLANAFANEMHSDFIYKMTGFDILKNNKNAKFIKELFKTLKHKNAVLFIDEIDVLASNEEVLLELTETIQKIKNDENYYNVVILLATNNLQKIHSYVKNFKKLHLFLPNVKEREEILIGYAQKYFGIEILDDNILKTIREIAQKSENMSGSKLEEIFIIMDELYLQNHQQISSEKLLESFDLIRKTF